MTIWQLGDHGIKTGTSPGVNNAAILGSIFAASKPGDTFVLPTDGDLLNYGELTFFDSPPPPVPNRCTLTGPNECPSAVGMVRRYSVSDIRDPFIKLSEESCTVQNMTLYIHQDYSSGSAIGIVQDIDKFVIHPRVRNVSTTVFGTGSASQCWAMPLCLDGSISDGNISRGIREARITDCAFWCYSYCGLYLRSVLGADIKGITLTPQFADPTFCDLSLDGNDVIPSYNNLIAGSQIGTKTVVGKAYDNLIIGHVGKIHFVDPIAQNNKFIDPVFGGEPEFDTGGGNVCWLGPQMFVSNAQPSTSNPTYHLLISPGNIAPGDHSDRPVQFPGAQPGQTAQVISAPPEPNCKMTAQITGPGTGFIRVENIGSDILWLSKDIWVDVVVT